MSDTTEPKREPMLSDEQIEKLAFLTPPKENIYRFGSAAIRDFYEAKITSGELRVVKTAKNDAADAPVSFFCSDCGTGNGTGGGRTSKTGFPYRTPFAFCPGCGAKIVEG